MTKLNSVFITSILNLNSEGQGIGEFEGLKVFIDLALPGEVVRARLLEKKKNYGTAELIEIIEKSPYRRPPICPIFSECGGCQIMHWDYKSQLSYKTDKVKNAFERIAGLKDLVIKPCLGATHPLYYRNKILLPFFSKEGKPSLGLYKKRSHDLVEVETCFIHCPIGQRVFETLKELLNASNLSVYSSETKKGFLKHLLIRSATHKQNCLVGFITSNKSELDKLQTLTNKLMQRHPEISSVMLCIQPKDHNVIMGKEWTLIAGKSYLEEELPPFRFRIAPNAFFQVNTEQALILYQKAIEYAHLTPTDTVLDAYCGIGMFSIFSAPYVKSVFGVECIAPAIRSAQENADLNQFTHLTFKCAPIEKVLNLLPNTNVVFMNPPRKGCDPSVIQALLKKRPSRIIYISCDPATLARDLSLLCKDNYRIDEIQPIDLFPQTTHVETVVALSLR